MVVIRIKNKTVVPKVFFSLKKQVNI